jgi:alpha-L-rhamnosidase
VEAKTNIALFAADAEVRALFQVGNPDAALSIVHQLWGHMATPGPYFTGTTWEFVKPDGTVHNGGASSLAHGWSSGATAALSQYMLGVQASAAGYKQWTVAPQFGSLSWAQGTVPSPYGQFAVAWQRTGSQITFTVTAPAQTSGTIVLPGLSPSSIVHLSGATSRGRKITTTLSAAGATSGIQLEGGTYTLTIS